MELLHPMADGAYDEYLRDESRSTGWAEAISFPRSEEEAAAVMKAAAAAKIPVTVQGARTGLTAAAVPHGGYVINASRMNKTLGLRGDGESGFFIRVQPGLLLTQLNRMLEQKSFVIDGWDEESRAALSSFEAGKWIFPPDPTEISASLGGMVSCNASGAKTFFYGPTRNYVEGLRLVLPDGDVLAIRRGQFRARGREFTLTTVSGRSISGRLPSYSVPQVKSAAGYYVESDMDMIDIFIGAEGTLGIVTEIELRLVPAPLMRIGAVAFMKEQKSALDLVRVLRGELPAPALADEASARQSAAAAAAPTNVQAPAAALPRPLSIEFFDRRALALLREQQQSNPAFSQLQPLPAGEPTAIYVEFDAGTALGPAAGGESAIRAAGGESAIRAAVGEKAAPRFDASPAAERELEAAARSLLFRLGDVITALGGSEENTWVATDGQKMEKLRFFRHACPECVNVQVDVSRKRDERITKLGTDMSVPADFLDEAMATYERDLTEAGLKFVIFGHVGQNHLHVNVIPRSMAEYDVAKGLYMKWARRIAAAGGSVAAEHGIGKLKAPFLKAACGERQLAEMAALKAAFDPDGLLGRNNIFSIDNDKAVD